MTKPLAFATAVALGSIQPPYLQEKGFNPDTYADVQQGTAQTVDRDSSSAVYARLQAERDAHKQAVKKLMDEQLDRRHAEESSAYDLFDAYNAKAGPKIQRAADLAKSHPPGQIALRKITEVSVPGEKELPYWAKAALEKVKAADRMAMDPTYKPKIQAPSYTKEPEEKKGSWFSRGLSAVGNGLSRAASAVGSAAKSVASSIGSAWGRLFS